MSYQSPWTYWAGDLRTGKLYGEVPVANDSWSSTLNAAGAIKVDLAMGDENVRFINPRATLEPAKSFLAVSRGSRVFNAGPVWAHDWDSSSETLTVQAANIWSYFDHRFIFPVLQTPTSAGFPVEQADTTTAGLSLRGVVAKLIRQSRLHTGGDLPISTVLYDGEVGTEDRTYFGYDAKMIGDVLTSISQEDQGPDIRFDAQFDPNDPTSIQWVLQLGNPYIGQQDTGWIYEDGTNLRQLLSVTRDGTSVANRAIATGSGSGRALLSALSQNTQSINDGYPLLEALASDSQETDLGILGGLASGTVNSSQYPQETWKVRVSTDDIPAVESINPGDTARFRVLNDYYLGSVEADARIISITYAGSSGGDCVDLTLTAPTTLTAI